MFLEAVREDDVRVDRFQLVAVSHLDGVAGLFTGQERQVLSNVEGRQRVKTKQVSANLYRKHLSDFQDSSPLIT